MAGISDVLNEATQDVFVPPADPSLVISPNLEALLDYDEKTRSQSLPASPITTSSGLRPPPRGPKNTRSRPVTPRDPANSATSPIIGRPSPDVVHSGPSSSSSLPVASPTTGTPNPYINPPPAVGRALVKSDFDTGSPRADVPPSAAGGALASPAHERLGRPASLSTFSPKPEDVGNASPSSPSHANNPSQQSQSSDIRQQSHLHHRLHSTLPTVDRIFGKGKGALGIFSESNSNSSKAKSDSSNSARSSAEDQRTEQTSQSFSLSLKRNKAKPPPKPAIVPVIEMSQRPDYVLDIQRSLSGGDKSPGGAPSASGNLAARTLISHGHRNSESSTRSRSSTSTHVPASTEESGQRISISSAIYPSSAYSHSLHSHLHRPASDVPSEPPMTFTQPPSDDVHHERRDSFMDLFSPSDAEFSEVKAPPQSDSRRNRPPLYKADSFPSPEQERARLSPLSPDSGSTRRSPKPPIPTSPKPNFPRSTSAQPGIRKASPRMSPKNSEPGEGRSDSKGRVVHLPPTTNYLNAQERANLVRKTQKLAQVFGQTPSARSVSPKAGEAVPPFLRVNADGPTHQRGAASMSTRRQQGPPTIPRDWLSDRLQQPNVSSLRRHSAPLSPDDLTWATPAVSDDGGRPGHAQYIEIGTEEGGPTTDWSSNLASDNRPDSPTSFIDLSDEDNAHETATSPETVHGRSAGVPESPSSPALLENMTPEERLEEERRRKRIKLAKLHRFLGSRVPTDLVLGSCDDPAVSLPPPASYADNPAFAAGTASDDEGESRMNWLRRRRSSSSAVFPTTWSDTRDRLKEDLNDKEKAINVRRAQKMEKVFGVPPPQTLYHTRHSPSPSAPSASSPNTSPTAARAGPSVLSGSDDAATSTAGRNRNQTPYTKQAAFTKLKKSQQRPGTSESNKHLLGEGETDRQNDVFIHYQQSLHSLNDIIDRDDKESLAELHQYLNGDSARSPTLQEFTRADRRESASSSIKSERRRSLPTRTSLVSLRSEYSITTPKPEVTDFQLRRRRAAKLTQFFGVDYRDLIEDVLESIEKGVEEDSKRGSLRPEEAQDLMLKLRKLKTKRGVL